MSSRANGNYTTALLKKSMIPLPCQECQLNSTCYTNSESIEWLWDLNNKTPIWSRLNEINTSGFKRKLPMSMTKNYDIEIKGRLWSLWGLERKRRIPHSHSKSYMAVTIMALCAARVINLNLWNTGLMDSIRHNGRQYYRNSLRKLNCHCKEFHLENLDTKCSLEGIDFKVHWQVAQQGCLYSVPLKCQLNLSYALVQFFESYKFGILQCFNRILGFGFIDGPTGGYFMYDAQSFGCPIFPKDISAPYLLRTNHLQVLLYCLIVSLNFSHMHASFCLYHVEIKLAKIIRSKTKVKSCKSTIEIYTCVLPKEISLESLANETGSCIKICKSPLFVKDNRNAKLIKSKYRRKTHNITKEEVEKGLIKPLVDADRKSSEDPRIKNDFIRVICSKTEVPLMPAELTTNLGGEFTCDLMDAFVMGRKTCLTFNKL